MIDTAALDREVRIAIATHLQGTGALPAPSDIATRSGITTAEAEEALARLAAAGHSPRRAIAAAMRITRLAGRTS